MRIAIDDGELDVLDEGRGPAVVMLHGFPLAKEAWDAQAAALRGAFRVIRPDLRGFGASSAPPGPYLMEQLASDVAAVLDALGIERAALVGHSMGTYVAFAFTRLFTERTAALALVCGRADADDEAAAGVRYALADAIERDGMQAAIDAYVPRYFAPRHYVGDAPLVARAEALLRRTQPAGAAAALRGIAARVAADDLFDDLEVPVLVVAGREDAIMSLDHNATIAGAIVGARLEVLDSGHFPLWECPAALNAALAAFLEPAKGS